MGNLIPIKLAEAALDAQEKQHQAQQYISKATYEALWMLYQQALEEVQMLKQSNRDAQLKITQEAALTLADLADKAFYYSREDRASADILIKAIRNICA